MIYALTKDKFETHHAVLHQMHQVRKRVFADTLHWDVPVKGDIERDEYDDFGPVYIIWEHERTGRFIGCMRLLPTSGPTLLNDTFRSTYALGADISHPCIWEGTRTCVDDEALKLLYPGMTPQRAFGLIMLAVCEWCLAHYVTAIVTNYEPSLVRVYRKAGVDIDEIGRAGGFGRAPVCCGLVGISDALLTRMRDALHVHESLLFLPPHVERAA